jgi:hypothetical protein
MACPPGPVVNGSALAENRVDAYDGLDGLRPLRSTGSGGRLRDGGASRFGQVGLALKRQSGIRCAGVDRPRGGEITARTESTEIERSIGIAPLAGGPVGRFRALKIPRLLEQDAELQCDARLPLLHAANVRLVRNRRLAPYFATLVSVLASRVACGRGHWVILRSRTISPYQRTFHALASGPLAVFDLTASTTATSRWIMPAHGRLSEKESEQI